MRRSSLICLTALTLLATSTSAHAASLTATDQQQHVRYTLRGNELTVRLLGNVTPYAKDAIVGHRLIFACTNATRRSARVTRWPSGRWQFTVTLPKRLPRTEACGVEGARSQSDISYAYFRNAST